jgi:hypothetical protein
MLQQHSSARDRGQGCSYFGRHQLQPALVHSEGQWAQQADGTQGFHQQKQRQQGSLHQKRSLSAMRESHRSAVFLANELGTSIQFCLLLRCLWCCAAYKFYIWCCAVCKTYIWCCAACNTYIWCCAVCKTYIWCCAACKTYILFKLRPGRYF